jgi:hypothetical protein
MDARYWSNEELVDETLKRLRETGHVGDEIPVDIMAMSFAERERLTLRLIQRLDQDELRRLAGKVYGVSQDRTIAHTQAGDAGAQSPLPWLPAPPRSASRSLRILRRSGAKTCRTYELTSEVPSAIGSLGAMINPPSVWIGRHDVCFS